MPSYTPIRKLPSGRDADVMLVDWGGKHVVLKRGLTLRGRAQVMNELVMIQVLGEMPWLPQLHHTLYETVHPTLVYEYYPNGDLLTYLESGASNVTSKTIARSLLETLADLHSRNIGHLDIKPENVVLDADFQLKLLDFGMATNSLTSRRRKGTVGYCAPEVMSGEEYSPMKADIWSFGILMIVVLYRFTPLKGVVDQIDFGSMWRDLDALSGPADALAKDFVERALQKEPARATAHDLLLHAWLN